MLGFVVSTDLSFPVIQNELNSCDRRVVEAAIQALRVLCIREKEIVLPREIKQALIDVALNSQFPGTRHNVIDAIADFKFA